jgi:adenine specific DNA methylase Mod
MKVKTLSNGDILTLADGVLKYETANTVLQFPCTDEGTFDYVESFKDYARERMHYYLNQIAIIKANAEGYKEALDKLSPDVKCKPYEAIEENHGG